MKKTIINKTQKAAAELMINKNYFSNENKRYFDVKETIVTGTHNNKFFMVLEKQGAFLPSGSDHNALKFVAAAGAETITGGFSDQLDGAALHDALKSFFNSSLGFFEKKVLDHLVSIKESINYKNTYLFESKENGFYLTINNINDIKIITHK